MSEESNIFDSENIPLSLRQFQKPDQPKLPNGRSNSLSVKDEDHLDINSVANVFERPRVKCATNVSAPEPWRWVVKMSDSLVWRRSRSLEKVCRSVRQSAA